MSKLYKFDVELDQNNAHGLILRGIGIGKRVLEVGCASGSQTKVMVEQLGCRVTGIEINAAAADEAKQFCEKVIVGNIESLDLTAELAAERFDVIIIADVLEHLYDPIKALHKLREFIADKGYLLASIPNIVHSSIIFEMAHGRFDYRKYGLLDDTHIRFFTRKNIYLTMESAGFVVDNMQRIKKIGGDTEFNTIATTDEDHNFLRYVEEHNVESETYQFIVKAFPAVGEQANRYAIVQAQEHIEQLREALEAKHREIRRLESCLAWARRPLLFRAYSKLKDVLRLSTPAQS